MDNRDLFARGALTVLAASRFSSLSRTTLYDLMQRGELRYTTVGRRRLIPVAELERVLAAGLTGGQAVPDVAPAKAGLPGPGGR